MNRRRKEHMRMFLFMEVEVVSVRIVIDRLTYIVYVILTYFFDKIKTIITQKEEMISIISASINRAQHYWEIKTFRNF